MITINRCGYNSGHIKPYDLLSPTGHADYTLLLIKTESFFEIDGQMIDMPPNTVMLYSIHSYVHYGCREPHFNDDWIHFELHDEDADLIERLEIPMDKPFVLPHMNMLTDYSRLLATEKLSPSIHQMQILDSLMHALLHSLAAQMHAVPDVNSDNKYFYAINSLRIKVLNAPHQKWDAAELAKKLHMSTSHFQHLYKAFFDVSLHHDIIAARIKMAKYYLRTTQMSIYSISRLCGYESELHFMRQFKKQTGLTPTQYRTRKHSAVHPSGVPRE